MPSGTGIVYHDAFLQHDTGPAHVERPSRLTAIVTALKEAKIREHLHQVIIDPAAEDDLLAVHAPEHLRFIRTSCRDGRHLLDEGDTFVSASSPDVAILAAGGCIAAADAVMRGILRNVFCAVRPPGHHACRNRVMGFCLINNIAVTARHIQRRYGVRRLAIVDWDVHHGNGTQEIFYDDPDILFISIHQMPLWPGTGDRTEQGSGLGRGATINIPVAPGAGESVYLKAFTGEIVPALGQFRPEAILISCGFDAHRDDPLAQIELSENSFGLLTGILTDTARRLCGGRVISVLEGGYNLPALAASAVQHIRVLMEQS